MRKKMIAGNWKMNKTPKEAVELVKLLKDKVNTKESDVVFCVPAIDIIPVVQELKGTDIMVGAQNMHYEDKGAYTGELSADMLIESGVSHVIIGHSERRAYNNETDETVNKKLKKAIEKKLTAIVCVGENLDERESGKAIDVVKGQVCADFKDISNDDAKKIVIAYEPLWAIGTGKTATVEQAEEVCAAIRNIIKEIYDEKTADEIIILYGGSVNGKNAAQLFAAADIDGGLVGGASLKEEFAQIVNYK